MHEPNLDQVKKEYHGTYFSYITGFFTCLLLTIVSFAFAIEKWLQGTYLIHVLIGLALIQAFVQLIFFLKLGHEGKPHWQLVIFSFMVVILLAVAIGSLWIMYDLNNRMMAM